MTRRISENVVKTARHASFYLSCGPTTGTPVIFVHGWPELSRSWRHQLPVFGGLGFRAVAPDMRGYGRSSRYLRHEDYRQEEIVADMIDILDALNVEKAIWVGHDWGAPVVWSIAQHHPGRCHGVASLCVPYIPEGFSVETVLPLANRSVYPEDAFPFAQWDYQVFYREHFAAASKAFETNTRATVKALFRAGSPAGKGQPALTSRIRAMGGWFGPNQPAPDLPRDESVLTEEDEHAYTAALEATGFFGADSWYMNGPANTEYARAAQKGWRLSMPVLFLHAAYDYVCETLDSRLAHPMRAHCPDLTEVTVPSGHWMAQERPTEVNSALAQWLALRFPQLWVSRDQQVD